VVALPDDLSRSALEVAALHEVAHVRRSDYAWHIAQRAVSAVFAAHPLVWAIGRGLDLDRERAADQAVLEAGGDRRSYADLLFSYATLPAPALALGAARGSSSLKSRIDAMTRPLSSAHARRFTIVGRLAGLVAVTLVMAGTVLVSPPLAAALEAETSAPLGDSTSVWIESMSLSPHGDQTYDLLIQLKPGADLEIAQSVANGVQIPSNDLDGADADSEGRLTQTVIVRFDNGEIKREVRPVPFPIDITSPNSGTQSLGPRSTTSDTTDVLEVADVQPQLIGGLEGLMNRLTYPEMQRRAGVEGQAVIQFVVSTEGRVTDMQVIRSAGNDGLDQAALEAVAASRFEPGMQDGQPVRVRFAVPVAFRLGDSPARSERRPAPGRVDVDNPEIFEVAEDQPELIGGLAALQERVVYPEMAREAGIEGQVVVQFVVNEQGRVEDAVVLRSPDDMLSRASLEAVNGLEFRPGQDGGVPVKTRFAVPVTFRLPAGDGVDRGEYRLDGSSRDRPAPERPFRSRIGYDLEGNRLPVRYAGVDIERLSPGSRQAFVGTYNSIPDIYSRSGQSAGDVEVRYTVDSAGRASRAEYVRGDQSMMSMAAFLVGTLELAADARPGPGGSSEGMLRIWYLGEG
ncbi:TonB family protein, partial [Rubrivirga sp.]|uniref:TonB family protein n=1 Tax=Rubrivirga sp. TaxID=1885344 RepID=UPI003C785AED